ncbi:uncharacterized protein [Epargyreus clarus]|uniref:uncharacterized protein n=1 Tax=Epargyreus clarus TaxID=520877 RepID=UPI003C2D312D
MLNNKVIFVALSVLLVFPDAIDGKKVRRKRPKAEEETSYPQPNVLTYSNFGFNDVGSYDGFVPSSPDYATFLSTNRGKEESTTRLYGPAFPTAMESSGFSNGFGSHLRDEQSFNTGNDGQLGLFHLEPNSMNSFSFTNVDSTSENKFSGPDSSSVQNIEKYKMPVYGAKINMKGKTKPYDDFNDANFKAYTTEQTTTFSNERNHEKYYKTKKRHHSSYNKQTTTEASSQQNVFNNLPNYPNVEPFMKTSFNNSSNLLNFPRVVDFTNMKQYYPNELEGNYPSVNTKPVNNANPITANGNDMTRGNSYANQGDKFFKVSSSIKNNFEYKNEDDKKGSKFHPNSNDDGFSNQSYNKFKGTVSNVEYKDKLKEKPWKTSNNDLPVTTNNDIPVSSSKFFSSTNDDFNSSKNSMKGYQYSTNHSSTSFKYDIEEPKKHFNNNVDEIVPASSNIGALDYQFPSSDFSSFNKIPNVKSHEEDKPDLSFNNQNQYKPSEEYLNRFKNLYTTTPTSSSNWGNIFKSTEYSFNKNHKKRPQYGDENINDEIVHIPKRPLPPNYGKDAIKSDDKPSDFPFYNYNYRPYRPHRPQYDWNKEVTSNRFKSEEDLLGLRTRDTLRPSYLPTFSSIPNEVSDVNNYKKLIEKWRTDYLKSKQKEAYHDYESYASDAKPIHVPLPKPYPIEVPHPVIVPVPQPYPVRVPVPKPVAVPVIQELMVPIEKPVPYPVIKKVPYPIEKPVPVPVEKQVPVPVVKPYPVPVPQIRPVFHHSKHRDEYNNLDHEDDADYIPRPESSKRVPYAKRPRSSRNRQRRPSRTTYPERSRRRWPQHQAAETKDRRYSKRPPPSPMESPYPRYRHRDREFEDFENEDRDYSSYFAYFQTAKMRAFGVLIGLAVVIAAEAATPQLRFAWKEMDYIWDSPAQRENAIKDGIYVPEHNLPLGLARWKNKLFVTVPRWKNGVASSLNYVDVDGPQDQPLKPYPSLKDNFVADSAKALPSNSSIISVFRVYVDACDRLWVMDSGLADILGNPNQVAGPSLVIFDLKTDQLLHRYYFKVDDMKEDSFFANVIVDVDQNTCDNAFAYVPDLGGYGVVVYSLKQDDSWRVAHHYFHFEPLAGAYNVGGVQFQWTDGVFGLALSEPRENGFRTMFFHAFSSTKEFCVSTELLRNYTHIDKNEAFHDFKLLGDRGERTQASASFYDPKTHVLFYTQVNRDGVGCWNSKKAYTPENNPLIFSDPTLFEFPNDLKVDSEDLLWVLSDKLPRFVYKSLDPNEVNYRIFSIKVADAIAGTACQ